MQQVRLSGRVLKSLKWGMLPPGQSAIEQFQLCREAGYDGIELVSPLTGVTVDELLAASRATGLPMHGVVNMRHWEVRLSSPQRDGRDQAVNNLRQALQDAHALHADSVLLVPGRVQPPDESHDDVWQRSLDGIRRALPLASRLGVRILIENVWNGFCETPELLRDYVDQCESPWVGIYFDIGNVRKFGASEDWIRVLGPRIVKLDVKDWGRDAGFCKIGDGDVDWPQVRQALADIGFHGWCTAEVEGGSRDRIVDIARRMNRVLQL